MLHTLRVNPFISSVDNRRRHLAPFPFSFFALSVCLCMAVGFAVPLRPRSNRTSFFPSRHPSSSALCLARPSPPSSLRCPCIALAHLHPRPIRFQGFRQPLSSPLSRFVGETVCSCGGHILDRSNSSPSPLLPPSNLPPRFLLRLLPLFHLLVLTRGGSKRQTALVRFDAPRVFPDRRRPIFFFVVSSSYVDPGKRD